MPDQAAGYFLTFTTYGARLHGDVRGSKDREHNGVGDDPRLRDDWLSAYERRELRHSPVRISPAQRAALERAFFETAVHRGWRVVALNVRLQHVHVVLTEVGDVRPERVMNDLKAYATRALRSAGLLAPDESFWSRHGSTRWLWNANDVEIAAAYTAEFQGADLPASRWRTWRDESEARA